MVIKAIKLLNILDSIDPKYTSLIVGGAVRDFVLGHIPNDIDIATNVPMDVLESMFETHDIGANKDFGIVVIKFEDEIFEIAQFRSEQSYSDGRHPDSVQIVSSFEEDSKRRDFTINSLGINKQLKVVDFHGGQNDIRNKVIRTVGNADERFCEDYLRMLRAIRFAARLGFSIEAKTMNAIQIHSMKIAFISSERIFKELEKMASETGNKFADAIELLMESNLLKFILPEVYELNNFEHSEIHHPEGGVLDHTIAALRKNDIADKYINMSILLHDIGKAKTYSFENGIHRYKGHAEESVKMIEDIALRLKFDNKMKTVCQFCAENHMKFHNLHEMKKSNVFSMMENDNWNTLVQACRCDERSRGSDFDHEWKQKEEFLEKLNERFEFASYLKSIRKVVNGQFVMSLRPEVRPCKFLGDIIKNTVDWIIDSELNVETDIEEIKQFVKGFENESQNNNQ